MGWIQRYAEWKLLTESVRSSSNRVAPLRPFADGLISGSNLLRRKRLGALAH
jgi:hypothetical protein